MRDSWWVINRCLAMVGYGLWVMGVGVEIEQA